MRVSARSLARCVGLGAVGVSMVIGGSGCAKPDTGVAADGTAIGTPNGPVAAGETAAPTGPGLVVGERVGEATLLDAAGQPVALSSLWAERPVVVTFYRGGWCPYCTKALTEWETKRAELTALGVDFVALTPERPDLTVETASKDGLGFTVLSDASFQAADAFRVRFSLDQETRRKYSGFGVDLGARNAAGVWDLPAPGTFLIDTGGVVRYAWADWDYRKRAEPDEVIAAARALRR